MTATVLIADDDRAIRDSLSLALRLEGYSVLLVDDGDTALHSLQASHVDVVVIDISISRCLDGLSACRAMRARNDRTPVLVLTARTRPSDQSASVAAGADDFLTKPFDFAELAVRLKRPIAEGRNS